VSKFLVIGDESGDRLYIAVQSVKFKGDDIIVNEGFPSCRKVTKVGGVNTEYDKISKWVKENLH
jgi:hypothetical protein